MIAFLDVSSFLIDELSGFTKLINKTGGGGVGIPVQGILGVFVGF